MNEPLDTLFDDFKSTMPPADEYSKAAYIVYCLREWPTCHKCQKEARVVAIGRKEARYYCTGHIHKAYERVAKGKACIIADVVSVEVYIHSGKATAEHIASESTNESED